MTLFEKWYIGMILVVIIQQLNIFYLLRKLGSKNEINNTKK